MVADGPRSGLERSGRGAPGAPAVFDADIALKAGARTADAWTVRQRRQPEAETFYERPLPNT